MANDFNEPISLFITWTTYGSWLPGDSRGWRKWMRGERLPQPLLEDWCRDRMTEKPVRLDALQRQAVEEVVREHAEHRGWVLHAVSARSNHVHVAVTVVPKMSQAGSRVADGVKRVRDELKANATRVLRRLERPVHNEKVWTKGGDIQVVETNDDLEQVVIYIQEAQDRMGRDE
ncbi:Transposase IS200 like [Neorhodopirellula lusitana]|uniref:Transposase IS200 like n=1 Tax=Neorhodopirellula lusitana TaxID=445327 RepID=A0ABY1Q9I0_9BACT|nr:transposase [Neorhodopirellula lusitana]SMP64308.1 Transposase IS200 like [Neorhodopirellula lusitana]